MSERSPSGRASRKFAWLLQVATDHDPRAPGDRLTGLDSRLAIVFATRWVNDDKLTGWRPQELLAQDLRVTKTAVNASIARLVSRGHLEVIVQGGGRARSSEYRLIIRDAETVNAERPNSPHKRSSQDDRISELNGQPAITVSPAIRSTGVSDTVNGGCYKRSTCVEPIPVEDSRIESRGEDISVSGASKTSLEVEFEQVWQRYPRKVSKGTALKAFRAARKIADLETITAGVNRYAAERSGADPKFTKHFSSWLAARCWEDEAPPPHSPSLTTSAGRHDGKAHTLAVLQHLRSKGIADE